jgi:hypothetical protein
MIATARVSTSGSVRAPAFPNLDQGAVDLGLVVRAVGDGLLNVARADRRQDPPEDAPLRILDLAVYLGITNHRQRGHAVLAGAD